ncbi:MAG: DUF3347 domain-containing protein [Chitinophagaceae bacterium]|nr:DUF3347 domain-containing protein [Chitinophagaceae bacterium]
MAKILNILAIVLPFLIIVLGLIRYYTDGKRSFGGTITFLAILLLLMGLFRYFFLPGGGGGGSNSSGPPPESLPVSKHSDAFNNSMETVINAYYKMTEGFVNWDTTVINSSGNELKTALDSLKIDELKKDSLIYLSSLQPYENARAEIAAIIADPSIAEKRGSLNILSNELMNLWSIVKYDRQKAYWQECPMAFGDDKPGNWLSKTEEVRNPYLGTKHPEYGNGMLNCGSPRDTIKFDPPPTAVDTTKKK